MAWYMLTLNVSVGATLLSQPCISRVCGLGGLGLQLVNPSKENFLDNLIFLSRKKKSSS